MHSMAYLATITLQCPGASVLFYNVEGMEGRYTIVARHPVPQAWQVMLRSDETEVVMLYLNFLLQCKVLLLHFEVQGEFSFCLF